MSQKPNYTLNLKVTDELYSELTKQAEKMDISVDILALQVLYNYVESQAQKQPTKMNPKDYKDLEMINSSIAKSLIEYSYLISQKVNNVKFEKEELWKIQNAFRGFNHGASAYKKIYRILQEAEPNSVMEQK